MWIFSTSHSWDVLLVSGQVSGFANFSILTSSTLIQGHYNSSGNPQSTPWISKITILCLDQFGNSWLWIHVSHGVKVARHLLFYQFNGRIYWKYNTFTMFRTWFQNFPLCLFIKNCPDIGVLAPIWEYTDIRTSWPWESSWKKSPQSKLTWRNGLLIES